MNMNPMQGSWTYVDRPVGRGHYPYLCREDDVAGHTGRCESHNSHERRAAVLPERVCYAVELHTTSFWKDSIISMESLFCVFLLLSNSNEVYIVILPMLQVWEFSREIDVTTYQYDCGRVGRRATSTRTCIHIRESPHCLPQLIVGRILRVPRHMNHSNLSIIQFLVKFTKEMNVQSINLNLNPNPFRRAEKEFSLSSYLNDSCALLPNITNTCKFSLIMAREETFPYPLYSD